MPITPLLIAQSVALTLAFVGCVVIWRFVLSPGARARRQPSPLPAWEANWIDFVLFGFYVIAGHLLFGGVGLAVAKPLGLTSDATTLLAAAGAQIGMLVGCLAYHRSYAAPGSRPIFGTAREVMLSGGATFLATMPVLMVASALCEWALKALGLPVTKQDSIEIFLRGESRTAIATLVIIAVVMAPITEELVFRAGLFRFLRTRVSRAFALFAPAVIFAIPHVNWVSLAGLASVVPLIVLAVIFSLAYERTGRIGTTIVAHALFNLNSIFFLLAGGGKDS